MKQNDFYAHLNEQKRKYKEKYLPYYKEYGEHLPTEILLSLKEYRQSLGMTALDVDDVIDKVKNPKFDDPHYIECEKGLIQEKTEEVNI